VAERADPLVASLGASLAVTDEIYQIRDFDAAGSRVLLRLDPKFGRSHAAQCAPARLRVAARLDACLRQRPRVLHRARP